MKKLLLLSLFSILALLSLFTLAGKTTAQDLQPSIDQAETDYRFQFDLYRQSYQEYQVAKSEWQKTKTIKAQEEALTAAKTVAHNRAGVQKAYSLWLRLRLLNRLSVYPDAQAIADRLETQANWFTDHQARVATVNTVAGFDEEMTTYFQQKGARDILFASGQIHLKLATLSYYQHLIRSLYEPILAKLETKQDIPEVVQGLSRVETLGEEINTQIDATKALISPLESGNVALTQTFRKVTEGLIKIQTSQIALLNLIFELEQNYGN